MAEYISRKALHEAFDNADADVIEDYGDGYCEWGFTRKTIQEVMNGVQSEDVAPVVHGRWEVYMYGKELMCSSCKATFCDEEQVGGSNYCPNCGAKMDGDWNG